MRLAVPRVQDPDTQRALDALVQQANGVLQFINAGDGVPSHTPAGPELWFRTDVPGVYVYDGVWTAL